MDKILGVVAKLENSRGDNKCTLRDNVQPEI